MKTEHDDLGIIIYLNILASMYFKCRTKVTVDSINTYLLEKKTIKDYNCFSNMIHRYKHLMVFLIPHNQLYNQVFDNRSFLLQS